MRLVSCSYYRLVVAVFICSISDDVLEDVLSNTVVPIAVEALYSFSGLKGIETLFKTVCSIIGLIDEILFIVDYVKTTLFDFTSGLFNQISGALTNSIWEWYNSIDWWRQRDLAEGEENNGLSGCR